MTPNINIAGILESNAALFPQKAAIIHGDRQITYAGLLRNVRQRAALFAQRGIGKGDGVLIVVPMSIPLYEILIALFQLGAVAVFTDAWADRKRLELARIAFPIKAFIGVGRAHLVRFVSPALRSIPVRLKAGLPDGWNDTVDTPASVLPNDPALITFTTGSTGAPKGANRTHGFLLAQHHALLRHLEPTPDDTDMATLPIFPLSNLAVGGTTLLPDIDFRNVADFDPASVAREIARHKVTTSAGSPAFFTPLAEYLLRESLSLPSLQKLYVGGAAVFPRTARLLRRAFPDAAISIIYGSTEAEPVSLIDAEDFLARVDRPAQTGLPVGRPVDSIGVKILPIEQEGERRGERKEEKTEADGEEEGEICVAGEHVLKSYIGDPAMWKEKFVDIDGETWLRTGDAGRREADGTLALLGRARNSWIAEGRRIFTLPVEVLLQEVEGVRAGTALHRNGETTIYIETEREDEKIARRIADLLGEHGIAFDRIVQMRRIPRDPRHASKIDYEKIVDSR